MKNCWNIVIEMDGDLHKNVRYKVILVIAIVAILTFIVAIWYKNSIYPFRFAEKFYKDNEKHINYIVTYFEGFDNIYSAQMKVNGITQTISSEGLKKVECTSDAGYESLLFLRKKYIDNSNEQYSNQSYMLNFVKAEYDDNGNMALKIPVYARILDTDGSVDSPNRIVYYLVYSDDNYSGDATSNIIKQNVINDNWFVISESHTPG